MGRDKDMNMNYIGMCKCAECGHDFYKYAGWGLSDGEGHAVCSPHCSEAARKRHEMEEKEAERQMDLRLAQRLEEHRKKNRNNLKRINDRKKKAVELFRNGEWIVFASIGEASRVTGWSHCFISRACRGISAMPEDGFFRFSDPNLRKPPKMCPKEKTIQKKWKPVYQLTPQSKELVARYASRKEAAVALGVKEPTITNCCSGKLQSCKGFILMNEEDFNELKKKGVRSNESNYAKELGQTPEIAEG
jgi:hypothetical protein